MLGIQTRRCKDHDYHSRCIYMITILKSPGIPVFCHISDDPKQSKISPIVHLHPMGELVYEELNRMVSSCPALRIINRVAMPDHLHFLLFVTQPTKEHLGTIIGNFKGDCTKAYRSLYPDSPLTLNETPFFQDGFNDKICFKAGQKDAFYTYIADNPRRYLVKKLKPEYFYHRTMIEIDGRLYGLYGNLFLLDNPVKSFVKISRVKENTPDLPAKIRDWEETIRCGGALVSPFINPYEKEYRDKAGREGAGIILIVNYLFSDRKKPYKELFDLCAEGRMLIISTEEYSQAPQNIRRDEAVFMNGIAEKVATIAPGKAILRARPKPAKE